MPVWLLADLEQGKRLISPNSEHEKLLASLFPDYEDFVHDFELSPFHCAVLDEYNSLDLERPSLDTLLDFAIIISTTTSRETWTSLKWQYRDSL